MRVGLLLGRAWRVLALLGYFLWELAIANALVAREVLTPPVRMRPGIIRVPLRVRTDLETIVFADLISLMPGTLVLEVADDREALFVHGLHVRSPDDFRSRIARLEDRVLRVLR